MANEKFYVTQEGYNDLINEHENLVHKVRQEVIVELQEARAQGDLSENADYDAAREHQAQVEGRIRELEAMIKNAEIISEADNAEDKKTKNVVKKTHFFAFNFYSLSKLPFLTLVFVYVAIRILPSIPTITILKLKETAPCVNTFFAGSA